MSKKGDKYYPMPTGELQGENVGEMPNKGTSTGFTGKDTHADGADLGPDATNRRGGFNAHSDDIDQCTKPAPKGRA